METQKTRKKAPLRSSQQDDLNIEKKVDEVLQSRSQTVTKNKVSPDSTEHTTQNINKRSSIFSFTHPEEPSHTKKQEVDATPKQKYSFFHLQRKTEQKTKMPKESDQRFQKSSSKQLQSKNQKIEMPTQREKGTKSTVVKTKKHIGFQKKKKDNEPTKQKTPVKKKTKKIQEPLPQFEESIAQVKPDEAVWLDRQIQAISTPQKVSPAQETESKKIEVVMVADDTKPQSSAGKNTDTPRQQQDETIFMTASGNTSDENISESTTLSQVSVIDKQTQPTTQKENPLDELIPDGQIKFVKEANQLKTYTLERMGYTHDAIEEIDFYPLHEPFAYVQIIREKESLDKRYVLLELELSKDEMHILKFIRETLAGSAFKTSDLETKGEDKYLSESVDLIIDEYMLNIDSQTKKKLLYYLEKESIGLGKLDIIMKDSNIEDISCDGSGVFIFLYHRRYGSLKSNVQFHDEDELTAFVVKLAQKCGKHISISEPMLDATMPDGSRIQMTLSTEVTTKGSTFTIRKFSEDPFSPPDLIEFHTMSSEMVAYMWLAVENGVNALIAGGTAAGKTSTLNALCLFIPRESKIVSIEETREINLPHPNWIPGVVRSGFGDVVGNKVIGEIDLYDLMKAALRQRPEYILVGEIRGKEAYVLFQAMATGHTTYSTVHADSAQSLIHRLEGKPIEIPRIMLQTLDVVCIQVISRVKNKRARRCKQIIEIIDIDPTTKEILTNEVFRWDPIEDKFVYSGKSYILERIRAEKDISREGMIAEIKNRTQLLDWMNKNNIREFKKAATIIAQYTDNPEEVLKKIRNE
jgi:flagellar protein FlaI